MLMSVTGSKANLMQGAGPSKRNLLSKETYEQVNSI